MKNVITSVIFLLAFIAFIASSYGIGRADSQDDKTLIVIAPNVLTLSIAVMTVAWVITWGFSTPEYETDFIKDWFSYKK